MTTKTTKKRPISNRGVPSASESFGFFASVVPFVRLPFVLIEVFAEFLTRFTDREGTTPAKKKVYEMPTRKSMKTKPKAA
jgi:hypothetical protein